MVGCSLTSSQGCCSKRRARIVQRPIQWARHSMRHRIRHKSRWVGRLARVLMCGDGSNFIICVGEGFIHVILWAGGVECRIWLNFVTPSVLCMLYFTAVSCSVCVPVLYDVKRCWAAPFLQPFFGPAEVHIGSSVKKQLPKSE